MTNESTDDPELCFFPMHIHDFPDREYIVAKLRRVSSPPVQEGSVSNSIESAVGRLIDIFRLGKASRNFHDLKKIKWLLEEQFQTDPMSEWALYEKVMRRIMGEKRMRPLASREQRLTNEKISNLVVALHQATMNDLPYLVASVGNIMGSPSAVLLQLPNDTESALARLRDVFTIGVQGQAFNDFAELRRKLEVSEERIMDEWRDCERAVVK